MKTLTKPSSKAGSRPAAKARKKKNPSSALAGAPVGVFAHVRTTPLDIVIEKPLRDPTVLLPFLSGGYGKPLSATVLKALEGKPGRKVGSVPQGSTACKVILTVREVGGEVSLRMARPDIKVGEEMDPDLCLTSVLMTGSRRFTEDDAWLVLELASPGEETPEQMTERIHANAFRMVNVVEHVPMPVAGAIVDLLRSNGFCDLTVRHAVPRK